MRLLVIGDEYYASLAAVRSLRRAGHEPWLAAVEGLPTFAEHSRATAGVVRVTGPREDVDAFARELAAHAARLGVAAVLPATEPALVALAGRDAEFGCPVGVPAPEVVDRAVAKDLLEPLAAQAGLRMPPVADPVELPAVVKPLRRFRLDGNRLTRLGQAACVETPAQLESYFAAAPEGAYVVQPHLPGRLRAVVGVADGGRAVCSLHQAAARVYPIGCGASAFAETVAVDADLDARARRLVELVGWSGIFELQFVEGADGTPYLVDVNPRVYGSVGLAVAAGHDLPAIWAGLVLGEEPTVGPYRLGTRFRAEERDVRAIAVALRAGRRAEALAALCPRPRTAHAVASLRDPLPIVHLARRALHLARG